ncbi:DsbA family protein, partial [Patescibacteria group bacterium]
KFGDPSLLVGLLLVGAFMLGSLSTQLKGLKNESPDQNDQEEIMADDTEVAQDQEEVLPDILPQTDREAIEDSEIFKGDPQAPVTIVEFSEYQCPFCKRYVDEAYSQIWEKYGDKIRYIFRDYPLPFHQFAQKTAEAARCAGDQDQYWDYHDILFAKNSQWSSATETAIDSVLSGFAREVGLDVNQFDSCLSSGSHTAAVTADLELGKKVGVSGTPSFFINGKMLVGAQPFEAFQAIIDGELTK